MHSTLSWPSKVLQKHSEQAWSKIELMFDEGELLVDCPIHEEELMELVGWEQ